MPDVIRVQRNRELKGLDRRSSYTQRATTAVVKADRRMGVQGKFLTAGGEKFYIRGLTYGPFHPDPLGNGYPSLEVIERDFAQMARNGLNAVRVFEVASKLAPLPGVKNHLVRGAA